MQINLTSETICKDLQIGFREEKLTGAILILWPRTTPKGTPKLGVPKRSEDYRKRATTNAPKGGSHGRERT